MPRICDVYPDICLTTEEKARKTLSQGSRRVPVGTMKTEYTEQSIQTEQSISGVLETKMVAARSTKELSVQTIKNFTHYKWEAMPHPVYRPNTRPPDSGLLPNLKEPLSVERFRSSEAVTATAT